MRRPELDLHSQPANGAHAGTACFYATSRVQCRSCRQRGQEALATAGGTPALRLLFSQEADARGEGAALASPEGRRGMAGIDDAVDVEGIATSGDIVEAPAEGEIVAQEAKAFFQLHVEGKISREAVSSGGADELLLIGEFIEGESGARFDGIRDFHLMNDGQFEEGEISPRQEAVGCIPRIWTGQLRAKKIAVDVEVESLIGVR